MPILLLSDCQIWWRCACGGETTAELLAYKCGRFHVRQFWLTMTMTSEKLIMRFKLIAELSVMNKRNERTMQPLNARYHTSRRQKSGFIQSPWAVYGRLRLVDISFGKHDAGMNGFGRRSLVLLDWRLIDYDLNHNTLGGATASQSSLFGR